MRFASRQQWSHKIWNLYERRFRSFTLLGTSELWAADEKEIDLKFPSLVRESFGAGVCIRRCMRSCTLRARPRSSILKNKGNSSVSLWESATTTFRFSRRRSRFLWKSLWLQGVSWHFPRNRDNVPKRAYVSARRALKKTPRLSRFCFLSIFFSSCHIYRAH